MIRERNIDPARKWKIPRVTDLHTELPNSDSCTSKPGTNCLFRQSYDLARCSVRLHEPDEQGNEFALWCVIYRRVGVDCRCEQVEVANEQDEFQRQVCLSGGRELHDEEHLSKAGIVESPLQLWYEQLTCSDF